MPTNVASGRSIVLAFRACGLRRASGHSFLSWMATIASFRAHGCCVQSQYRFTLSRLYTQTRVWPQFPFVDGASDHSFISGPWILRLITVLFYPFSPTDSDARLATVYFPGWCETCHSFVSRPWMLRLITVSFHRFAPMYPDARLATVQFLSSIVCLTTASFRAHGRCLFIVSVCLLWILRLATALFRAYGVALQGFIAYMPVFFFPPCLYR